MFSMWLLDVSEGNILMVPCDVEEDGEAFVEHRGLLIDWEYAERTSRRALPGFSYRAIRRVSHLLGLVSSLRLTHAFFHRGHAPISRSAP